MRPLEEIYTLLDTPRKVVITMHQKPDGDAMGSALGLYHYLKTYGHDVVVISPTNWADFLEWMPGTNEVIDYEREKSRADLLLQHAEWIFCLDFNVLSRTKRMEESLAAAPGDRILIDHHQQPEIARFTWGRSDVHKSSTAEMVYDFITESGGANRMSLECIQSIYTGVMTDTGSFRFPATTASVHRLVADLKDRGLQHSVVHENIYDNFTENRFRFIGHVLSHLLDVYYEYNTAIITVPQQILQKFDIKTGDTEGLVNYPLGIQGIRLAVIIVDRGEERKLSFRSKGGFDVNIFARKYFNGGGHASASGGSSYEPLEKVKQQFLTAMRENAAELSSYSF